jgi:hypothetical protein
MKKLLFSLLITSSFLAQGQVYNNEWINYSKTYYKFKVGRTGVYRIPQSVLAASGLGSIPAEQLQLWRNGAEVPLYTSAATGTLGSSDYIEFWGEINDGQPDNELYRQPDFQLNKKWSLETDTAAYFLTIDPAPNRRLQTTANNVVGNTLPAEPYFMHTEGQYYRAQINSGYAVNVGEYLYSSSYDKGEGWSSSNIGTNGTLSFTFNNLNVYTGSAPDPMFSIAVSGNAIHPRTYRARINGDTILSKSVDYFNAARDSASFSISKLTSNTALVSVLNNCPIPNDRMVVHQFEMRYPRNFNFGNATNFEFKLPATAQGAYLEISGFSYGSTAPVLYDITNEKRYVVNTTTPSLLKVVLEPSATERRLIMVSQDPSVLLYVSTLQTRNFINYQSAANQGDYLIITNPLLFGGAGGSNPVNEYVTYRNSTAGGSHNAKIYLADELVDQFGFGIKKNPAAIRNFIQFAKNRYASKPRHVFILGKGVHYVHQRSFEHTADIDRLNLVPAFGWPASDVLLAAQKGSSIPDIPIGRLSAITPEEVATYLKKIKEFELAQATLSPNTQDRAWMKNVVHIIGASDPALDTILKQYMGIYRQMISDTLFGANVTTFSKSSSNAVEQLNNTHMQNLFAEGISLITYFGHSSSTTLEFNLDNPENYNNPGKYPMFLGLGCNAGNFFNYNPLRFRTKETLSEKYVLAQDRGTIGFVASTHFGIVHYLDIWNARAYKRIASSSYGKSFGEIMRETVIDVFNFTTQEDFYARSNAEQTELHGDPAITLNPHAKADYVIEDPMVKVSPGFISIAEPSFRLEAKMMNIGRAPDRKIVVEVKRQYPNGTIAVIRRDTIPGIRYSTTLVFNIPIDPNRDKGLNKITVTIDADNVVDEFFENNNSITKDVVIFEDEARPVYPYNFAIVNRQNIRLKASTANPFADEKQYRMEMDTTELFNSAFKITRNITAKGGVIEFDPGIAFTDSTVYYWRVAVASNTASWNGSSFVYLANHPDGFNQSHHFQHLKSTGQGLTLDSTSRLWKYGTITNNLFIRLGSWVTSGATQQASLSVAVNGTANIRLTCWFQSVVFNVFDPITFKPWVNRTVRPNNGGSDMGEGLYGSLDNRCFGQEPKHFNFEYRYTDTSGRRKAMDFMRDVVPTGAYIVVRNFTLDPTAFPNFPQAFINDWIADQNIHGQGQSLYHYLKGAGLVGIDSFYRARPWALVYKKGDPSYTPKWIMGEGTFDNPTLSADCFTNDTLGYVSSPRFGPARAWKELHWDGTTMDATAGDDPKISVIGVNYAGVKDTLIRNLDLNRKQTDISSIDAKRYPFIELRMRNADTTNFTPYQLRYWRLTYDPAPEGAVAPNLYFSMRDSIDAGEPLEFKMAFKNISDVRFDSLKVKMVITDRNNVSHVLPVQRHRALAPNDTLHIRQDIDSRILAGANVLYVEVNPDNDQPEQYHFNNFVFRNLHVYGDTLSPLMDVTFDNVHILNNDIIRPDPDILIRLKDESKWAALNDTSRVTVKIRYPDGSIRPYYFSNIDTVEFQPAQPAPSSSNTATVRLKPHFTEDGEYELIVSGKDASENSAGTMDYKVSFEVINKPMISNLLNYPNPFTTSTAFVFTLTGNVVPQNMRIQILTVTGKIVREITKEELGPLRIGRNITEFKWDGTDQYGQRLANGVYLYRVITNLNGKSLDKYKGKGDDTDKYFNKGYGKMYLMR